MGNQREYKALGGFSQYLYKDVTSMVEIGGIKGKVIKSINVCLGEHDRLPTYSNTSDIYFKLGKDGFANQAKVYVGRRMILDFDWGHLHKNPDGSIFEKGVVHVQEYGIQKNGVFVRFSNKARRMSIEEIKIYGPIIKYFNPYVKF